MEKENVFGVPTEDFHLKPAENPTVHITASKEEVEAIVTEFYIKELSKSGGGFHAPKIILDESCTVVFNIEPTKE